MTDRVNGLEFSAKSGYSLSTFHFFLMLKKVQSSLSHTCSSFRATVSHRCAHMRKRGRKDREKERERKGKGEEEG